MPVWNRHGGARLNKNSKNIVAPEKIFMSQPIQIARNINELETVLSAWRTNGQRIGLVPTMGALHAGHLSLIDLVAERCDKIVATIFVNPTQFGASEDLERYPRDEDADLAKLDAAGCDLVFIPDATEIYPNGNRITVEAGQAGDSLCGTNRPGHFDGVATVVARLFDICAPDTAIFGEKDYQQLMVIKEMADAEGYNIDILSAPIVRDSDGLALSSRNDYLSPTELATAKKLNVVLTNAIQQAGAGKALAAVVRDAVEGLRNAGFTAIDYIEFRHGDTLAPVSGNELGSGAPVRVFAAARIGRTRLIDNMPI